MTTPDDSQKNEERIVDVNDKKDEERIVDVDDKERTVGVDDKEIIFNVDDEVFEKKLLRKVDLRVIPLLTLLYLLSFLDRVNIGNAKLAHLERDLGLINNQYNWSLSIFFIGYILFEVPSNLVLLKTSPSAWIPTIMVAWGITMSIMAFVKNYQGLLSARFFLGVFESGFFPAIVYYVTMWYKRSEQNLRFGFFSVGVSCAGSFSGLLAYSIVRLDGKLNLKGWQWLFLLEGLFTILVAGFSFIYLSDYPDTAKWLNEKERKFAINRLKEDIGKAHTDHLRLDKKQIYVALKDWKIYTTMLQVVGFTVPIYSFSYFLPSIVNGMGFDFVISQLLSAPPFFCGAVSTLFVAVLSDSKRIRGPFIIASSSIGLIGYVLLSIPSFSVGVKYFGACIIGMGIFPCFPTAIAWLTNNLPGNVKRGIAVAMIVSAGSTGAIFAPQIYRPKDRPHYLFGNLMAMGFLFLTICSSVVQYVCLKNINKKKRENPQSFLEGKDEKEIADLGDEHPDFIYLL